jgi:hypothetical protein
MDMGRPGLWPRARGEGYSGVNLRVAKRWRVVLTSLGRASSRLYSRSGRASARSTKLAIVLPIDAIFARRFRTDPGAPSATRKSP